MKNKILCYKSAYVIYEWYLRKRNMEHDHAIPNRSSRRPRRAFERRALKLFLKKTKKNKYLFLRVIIYVFGIFRPWNTITRYFSMVTTLVSKCLAWSKDVPKTQPKTLIYVPEFWLWGRLKGHENLKLIIKNIVFSY